MEKRLKNQKLQSFILLIICILLCLCISTSFATNNTQLKKINTKIATIKSALNRAQSKRQHLQNALEKNETAIAHLSLQINKTNHKLLAQQKILQQLEQKERMQQQTIQGQQNTLNKQIFSAYLLGRQPYLKLILNQQDPSKLSRIITYYGYITRQRITTIKKLQTILMTLQHNQEQLEQQYQKYVSLKQQQIHDQQSLQLSNQNRHQLIKKINNNIQTKSQKLAQLLHNKNQLEKTLDIIAQHHLRETTRSQAFVKLRGQLPWPTHGRISNLFGTAIEQSQLKWSGVLIHAPQDQPIKAIANGRVVFAQWLSGYGLLLIISHGNGYLTLYGRNHTLYKKVGDVVHRGEVIAKVGKTGGYKKPALYFAIRHNTTPLNPTRWCK